jgi:probable biosynthetic protein (TIGR04098 family)
VSDYDLTLGMPHTNRFGLWEPLLMMQAAHAQWSAIAGAIGQPLSRLRSHAGGEVYAAFYYIETVIPASTPIESFRVDDTIRFRIALRAFKNIAIEGRLLFDRPEQLGSALPPDAANAAASPHPYIRFGNIFITPSQSNNELLMAPPVNADFSQLAKLPNAENPYAFTRDAKSTGRLGIIDDRWTGLGAPFTLERQLDPDRDTNGAGLVYFANYLAYVEIAVREALIALNVPPPRSLRRRQVAYFGNADPGDSIRVHVESFTGRDTSLMAHRCRIERSHDRQMICITEAVTAARPA